MTKVAHAVARLARAEAQAATAREELYAAIREAYAAGESVRLIAQLAGISRQRVWQIVREGRRDG